MGTSEEIGVLSGNSLTPVLSHYPVRELKFREGLGLLRHKWDSFHPTGYSTAAEGSVQHTCPLELFLS